MVNVVQIATIVLRRMIQARKTATVLPEVFDRSSGASFWLIALTLGFVATNVKSVVGPGKKVTHKSPLARLRITDVVTGDELWTNPPINTQSYLKTF